MMTSKLKFLVGWILPMESPFFKLKHAVIPYFEIGGLQQILSILCEERPSLGSEFQINLKSTHENSTQSETKTENMIC